MNQSFPFATTPPLLMQCSTKRARYQRSRNERGTTGLNNASGGPLQLVAADQNFGRELQARRKPPDHLERERAHAVEHFRNPRAGTDVPLQILARQAARFHDVEQKVDRVGRLDRGVLALVGLDEQDEHLEPVGTGAAFAGVPQRRGFLQRRLVLALVRIGRSSILATSNRSGIDSVVLAMRADEPDEHHAPVVVHRYDETIVVALDVETTRLFAMKLAFRYAALISAGARQSARLASA